MKKIIGFTNPSPDLLQELIRHLQNSSADGSEELAVALRDLLSGDCSSLVLKLEEGSVPVSSQPQNAIPDPCLESGGLIIQPRSRRVIRDGLEISLTQKEFDTLYFLAKNRGEVFTKEQIYQAVWEDQYMMDDSNIMAIIRRLRKKIEPNPDSPIYIQTVWGIGYMFNDRL